MKNKKVKNLYQYLLRLIQKSGCGRMFFGHPDYLICGKNIKTSEGKIKWYCSECLEKYKFTNYKFTNGVKLNLGCGKDYKEGFINVDLFSETADVKHDLNKEPYPFEDNSVDYILADNILEHLKEPELFIREILRILKVNAIAEIKVPHYKHPASYMNIGHRLHFHENALDIWKNDNCSDCALENNFEIIEKKVKRNGHRFWIKQSITWKIRKI